MRYSVSPERSLLLAVFGFILLLLAVNAAAAPQQPAADCTRLITDYSPTKLQKELNEAAATGCRISRALPGLARNPVADMFLTLASPKYEETSGALVTMEKIPSGSANYEYAVVKFFARISSWERDINKAAARGFRVVPGNTFTLRQGFVFGTMDVPISIMEKAPDSSGAVQYAVVEARQMGNFERELDRHFQDGYGVIWLGHITDHKVALMEKRGSSAVEARLLVASKDDELQQKLRAVAGEHFCIVASTTSLTGAWHGYRLAYMEKCETSPEYIFVKNDQKARTDFDKAITNGYRLVPAGVFGETITLVKAPAGEHYEYRFFTNSAEADEAKKAGYTELRLSDSIRLGGLVLEREVASAREAPQQQP